MKFPKDMARISITLKDLSSKNDYQKIVDMKDEMFFHFDDIKDSDAFIVLVKAMFMMGYYYDIINIGINLIHRNYEYYEILYYILASCIRKSDLYQAMSIINNSKSIQNEDIISLLDEDGANYTAILNTIFCTKEACCLILANFIKGLVKEESYNKKIDEEYMLYRLYDLLNTLNEIGTDPEVTNELTNLVNMMFINKM